jgi:hypothetical protein
MDIPGTYTIRTIDLDHGQMMVAKDLRGNRVQVLFGGIWLTEEGQLDDRFAFAGGELGLTRNGRAVIEGLGRTRIIVAQPLRRWAHVLREQMDRLALRPAWMRAVAMSAAFVVALGLAESVARGLLSA